MSAQAKLDLLRHHLIKASLGMSGSQMDACMGIIEEWSYDCVVAIPHYQTETQVDGIKSGALEGIDFPFNSHQEEVRLGDIQERADSIRELRQDLGLDEESNGKA